MHSYMSKKETSTGFDFAKYLNFVEAAMVKGEVAQRPCFAC
jgi:hypothetical protein